MRAQQAAQQLPGCRAYELVSPADKANGQVAFPIGNGNALAGQSMLNAASRDGNTVAFWSYAAFADPRTGLPAEYRAKRNAGGWQTEMWSPAAGFEHPWLIGARSQFVAATEDLSTAFLETPDRFDPNDQDSTNVGFGEGMDVYSLTEAGTTWLSRPNVDGPDAYPASAWLQGHSADGSKAVFETPEPLVSPAGEKAELVGSFGQLYERAGGQTALVSVDDGGALLSDCGAILGAAGRYSTKEGAVSRDGSRIFFTTPSAESECPEPRRLYLREGDSTVWVSASQRSGGEEPSNPAVFEGATPSGNKVFFSSVDALTDDATPGGSHVYAYDVPSGDLKLLADFRGTVIGFSDDGERVYVMSGSVEAEGPGILIEDGVEIPFASLVGGTTSLHPQGYFPGRNESPLRVTPDGRYIFFPSTANLTSFDSHGAFEFYRYDAITGETACVSCNTTGKPPVGDAEPGGDVSQATLSAYPKIRYMSEDGRRIVFGSSDRLVPEDQTSPTGYEASGSDVYEWLDGQLSLISDGVSSKPSVLFAVGAEGRDVFFGTTSALAPQDVDGGDYDIYDAREGGGFLAAATPPACSAEGCQSPPALAPQAPVIGSSVVTGPGNRKAKARCRKPKRRHVAGKRAEGPVKHRCHRQGRRAGK